jgi:pumilio RNA-binding family
MSCNKNIFIRDSLIRNLERECLEIVQDPYGNYAIQYALEYYGISVCVNLINAIVANIVLLSNQKFASNVVEKCIESGSEVEIIIMIKFILFYLKNIFRIIIAEMFLNNHNFMAIMKNKYGNFVLIKAIKTMSAEFKIEVKNYLLKNISISCGKERTNFNYIIDQFF